MVAGVNGAGIGYLDVAPAFETDVGKDLGNAIGFRFEAHISLLNGEEHVTLLPRFGGVNAPATHLA